MTDLKAQRPGALASPLHSPDAVMSPAAAMRAAVTLPPIQNPAPEFRQAYGILEAGGTLEAALHHVQRPSNPHLPAPENQQCLSPLEVMQQHPIDYFHMRYLRLTVALAQLSDRQATFAHALTAKDRGDAPPPGTMGILKGEIDELSKETRLLRHQLNDERPKVDLDQALRQSNAPAAVKESATWIGRHIEALKHCDS